MLNLWKDPYQDLEAQGMCKLRQSQYVSRVRAHIFSLLLALAMSVVALHFYIKTVRLSHEFEDRIGPRLVNIDTLTHDVIVKPIHSHNDEWRRHPLVDALRAGANSVEADCFYFPDDPDTIYVGHNSVFLKKELNIDSLYLDHLYDILEKANVKNDTSRRNGIFYTAPETTTYFYIDIKNNGEQLLQALEKKLERFLAKGYLTSYSAEEDEFHEGPLTVIITGDFPYDYISSQKLIYTFIDAPLKDLVDPEKASLYPASKISIFSSASLSELTGSHKALSLFDGLSAKQLADLEKYISAAHKVGLKTRIWDTPRFTKSIKHTVWKQLIALGSDYLNTDELKEANSI
ncbi:hypothetical protein KL930_003698 [Ogataea haglerorum]|uniref:Altered inheritance of mitochondria protein 6 n=1 Tax=Ogataea haglerorum TaxID=1937702 RepID=A0ABQ7RF02_9ASCO|nr:uncharacterized protein KL911_003290 [Ogataea haglerorum]KAG7696030.1 hypothetical protein KL951_003555 [Ogataea haglerorum]KAG7707437.1 hypothetical protein KL950_003097 [Ogataea haglerorum]KAG7718267.1 hypothetical protein KL913_002262 [Ogataea haglerorum]KAG7718884.1 hypothetical protein KL949_002880 [Ogataea haglerorum]KAG7743455.1 hypothetical protein KL932_002196 [Ogataea haglerorum]